MLRSWGFVEEPLSGTKCNTLWSPSPDMWRSLKGDYWFVLSEPKFDSCVTEAESCHCWRRYSELLPFAEKCFSHNVLINNGIFETHILSNRNMFRHLSFLNDINDRHFEWVKSNLVKLLLCYLYIGSTLFLFIINFLLLGMYILHFK